MINLRILFISSILPLASHSQAAVNVFISPPENQNVTAGDFGTGKTYTFLTETFSSPSTGNFTGVVGTHTGTYALIAGTPTISNDSKYGGGTGQGKYLSINNGVRVSITFDSPVNYFGFQWTAGNAGNQVTLYDTEGTNIGTFDTATITTMLPKTNGVTIQAVNGANYATTSYYGLPGDRGTTSGEAFAYIHFVNSGLFPIARIELSHSGGGSFESDNHSIRFDKVVVENESSPLVSVGEVVVPEPSAVALLGLASGVAFLRRKR